MKVSVIIPFYRGLGYLQDCMQSLVEQSYQDMEIILVCDHVQEDVEAFLKPYQAVRPIKVLHLTDTTGVAAARNCGLNAASGEYVYFLDGDDYIHVDTIEQLVQTAEVSDSDVVYGKKFWTWLKRNLYLKNLYYAKGESEEEEEDGESSEGDQSMDNETDGFDAQAMENKELSPEERQQLLLQKKQRMAYYELLIRRKSLRSVTILHVLMKRSLITEHHIQFNESIRFLSDYPFLLQILKVANSFERNMDAVYVKRNHSVTSDYPSLGNDKESKSFQEYVDTYEYAKTLLSPAHDLRMHLDKKIINYCVKYYAPQLRRRTAAGYQKFPVVHRLISQMDKGLILSYKGYRKRLLKAFYHGNLKKAKLIVNFHLLYRKLKNILGNRRALAKFLYNKFFLKQPMKDNWVLCESFFGKSYSDSPKYVYEYLSKNYPGKYKFIWVIDKKNAKIPYKHKKIRRYGIKYAYYLARCKYYVFNVRQPEWVKKREGNVFLETWHGTPLKRLVFDLEDVSSGTPRYKRQFYKQSRAWDYLVAPNQYSSDIFKRCFRFDNKMLETGYPRNDILHYKNKDQIASRIKDTLGIPKDKKVILYAPTWRDDEYYTKTEYKFSLMLDLEQLRQKLGKEHVIILRTHYFIADSLDLRGLEGFAYDASRYDDVSELYLISDYLITDYSSVFFDYANLKRPMLFFMYDLEKYRDILHGFYMNIEEELPGPILFTTEEIIDAINNIDSIQEKYQEKYDAFYEKYCSWEDGTAAERVAKTVFQLKG